MRPAARPRSERDDTRLLVVDPATDRRADAHITELPRFLAPGDLIVLNDAATLPGSLPARTAGGEPLELRLAGPADAGRVWAVAFGPGDFRMRTEDRPAPPELREGDALQLGGAALRAIVRSVSPISKRLVELDFERDGPQLWAALYALGSPVQYSYHDAPVALWSVQTAYASRPWAAEMPSAGRPLSFRTLRALSQRGVALAALTHAAGLSSTGDPALDAALPLPERYDIPAETVASIERTRASGGRVVAVGTTVVRALEGSAANGGGRLRAGSGVTSLRIDAAFEPGITSALLTGMHSPAESHYQLLAAFAREPQLRAAFEHADRAGYLAHEFGDATLIAAGSLAALRQVA